MYCLRCGVETGDDQEYCVRCANEVVSDRVLNEEELGDPGENNITRCRTCKQEITAKEDPCPYCGAVQEPAPSRQ
jgi:RNA polymerase subunit RPABC4/transcription elongation factor Spt4